MHCWSVLYQGPISGPYAGGTSSNSRSTSKQLLCSPLWGQPKTHNNLGYFYSRKKVEWQKITEFLCHAMPKPLCPAVQPGVSTAPLKKTPEALQPLKRIKACRAFQGSHSKGSVITDLKSSSLGISTHGIYTYALALSPDFYWNVLFSRAGVALHCLNRYLSDR